MTMTTLDALQQNSPYSKIDVETLVKKVRANPDFNWDWKFISMKENLPEDFIREFNDKVIWYYITNVQYLSDSLILDFQERIFWPSAINLGKLQDRSYLLKSIHKKEIAWDWINDERIAKFTDIEIIADIYNHSDYGRRRCVKIFPETIINRILLLNAT